MLAYLAVFIFGLVSVVGSAYLYWKLDWKSIFIFFALICAMVITTGSVVNIPVLSTPFVLGGMAGITFRKDKSVTFYLLTTTAIVAGLTAGFFYYSLLVDRVDFFGMQRESIARSLEAAQVPPDLREQWMGAFEGVKYVLPFGIVLNAVIGSSIAYVIVKNLLVRMFNARPVAGLEFFRVHEYFIFALIAGLAVYLLISKEVNAILHIAGLNIMLVAALVYMVQGLAVIKYFFIHRGVPTYIIPLTFIGLLFLGIAGIWAILFLMILLAGFGALDIWADFRKFSVRNTKEN